MRVISGKLKGKKLLPINELKIRPTSDRSKETIFNTLNSIFIKKKIDLLDMVVLDGFCGSGALGIEAFSRGARKIYFIDNCIKSLNLAKKNCSVLQIVSFVKFFKFNLLEPVNRKINADLFFLDPPYSFINHKEILNKIYTENLVSKKSIGVLEFPKNKRLSKIENFNIIQEKIISNSVFFFLEAK
tara:strand:- start:230 stop:787 length:558 start_codon:yes stop_codon:yes gene_type:complete